MLEGNAALPPLRGASSCSEGQRAALVLKRVRPLHPLHRVVARKHFCCQNQPPQYPRAVERGALLTLGKYCGKLAVSLNEELICFFELFFY